MIRERTLILIKPESIQRHLIGELISRFEKRGLKLIACKLVAPTAEQVGRHYPDDEAWYLSNGTRSLEGMKARGIQTDKTPIEISKETRRSLIEYYANRPLLAMVWEGAHACALGRKTVGSTNCLEADIGSVRGDYSQESYGLADSLGRPIQTLVHASGSPEEAEAEIKVWFDPQDILDYDLVFSQMMLTKDWGRVKKDKEK